MDNLHLLIVVILLSFGTGHAIFRSKFGIMTMVFLSLFIYFIYSQIQGAQWSVIAISAFIAGIVYAYRESSEGMLDEWLYRVRELIASVKSKFSFKREPKKSQADNQTNNQSESYQETFEAEQARREQEAKAQRNKNKQQEEPENHSSEKQEYTRHSQQKTYREKQDKIHKSAPVSDTRTNLEILGLSPGFTQEELKKAFKRESSRSHPDKWTGKPTHIQKAMEEEQKLVNKAYDELKN